MRATRGPGRGRSATAERTSRFAETAPLAVEPQVRALLPPLSVIIGISLRLTLFNQVIDTLLHSEEGQRLKSELTALKAAAAPPTEATPFPAAATGSSRDREVWQSYFDCYTVHAVLTFSRFFV